MAIIKKKEIQGMNEKALNERLKDLKLGLLKMNAQKSAQMKNVKIRETKRTIARIFTMLNRKAQSGIKQTQQKIKKQEKENR